MVISNSIFQEYNMGGTIKKARTPMGKSDIIRNDKGIPRKKGRSLIVDKKRGRPAGTPRTQQEIDNQKASIAKSREAGTWRAGRFPVLKERK